MDLSKLSPAPWPETNFCAKATGGPSYYMGCSPVTQDEETGKTDAAFIALARSAFDVMMRRGWCLCPINDDGNVVCWHIDDDDCDTKEFRRWNENTHHQDPFTALVEADRWYRANVEGKQQGGRKST